MPILLALLLAPQDGAHQHLIGDAFGTSMETRLTTPPPHADNPAVIEAIRNLKPGSSMLLPPFTVEAGGLTLHGVDRFGPGPRDYCNKMAYAPERQTALYAGGNHQVPHRMNDVWEYHLGSNTWHLLYAPDGGNPGKHKGAYFLTSRTLVRDPDRKLSDKEKGQIEAYRKWWKANVVLKDGHITTTRGGPIMPAHTWDAFCYDARSRKLIWGMGVNPAAQVTTHSRFTGVPVEDLEKKLDPAYTPLWMFDPQTRRWIHYRTSKPHAALRGMGATMVHLTDRGTNVWYVAAQNVSPAAFEMWAFDATGDAWSEIKPNGGKRVSTLATQDRISPMSEQQTAYSEERRMLVAVLKHDTFLYDPKKNEWTRGATDERIYGHDARSVFAHDRRTGAFLLAFPPKGKGKKLALAAFSLDTRSWTLIKPDGPAVPEIKYGNYAGYYDPRHDVFVIQGRYRDQMWLYRHRP